MTSAYEFTFLNETHRVESPAGWDDQGVEKLWRYNLHYFDDLNAKGAEERTHWHRELMERWVAENPPGRGTGWEPYPVSLRIVNWIKWVLRGNELSAVCRLSLAVQARWLMRNLETHLLGNHLFANAKALVFAGLFFEGPEASRWLERGMGILARQIPEQILADGGHFERSTMYHALALEDMLDLCNAASAYAGCLPKRWAAVARKWGDLSAGMATWLKAMSHPDGEIGFFNDAAIGIALSLNELENYAGRLGITVSPPPPEGFTRLADSGYIRIQKGPMVSMLDVAAVGPDYLPAHAHADTLSFELSLYGQRVFVNSGTSCYGAGPERQRQRGTAAHNTVVVGEQNSSDVWGAFRVGRRAKASVSAIDDKGATLRVSASHDGYRSLTGKNIHSRCWRTDGDSIAVEDEVSGRFDNAVARFHLHPEIEVCRVTPGENKFALCLPKGQTILLTVDGGRVKLDSTFWHPEFGRSEANTCISIEMQQSKIKTTIEWGRIN